MNTLIKNKCKINDSDYRHQFAEPQHYDEIIKDDAIVQDAATGKIIAVLAKHRISKKTALKAYPALMRGFTYVTDNRGAYSGTERIPDGDKKSRAQEVRSFTAGFFERQGGYTPICRATAFTRNEAKAWAVQKEMLAEMAAVMSEHAPARHKIQMEFLDKIAPEYKVDGLPFTTTAVNISVRAAYHRDRGDFKNGMGCMAVLKKGTCVNWLLGLPEYRVALDIGDRDVILFDPHLLHATSKGTGIGKMYKDWNRISVVAYVREKLVKCLPHKDEIRRARKRYEG
jgi:hypothetical protein